MKTKILITLLVALAALSSCHKNSSSQYGSWTYKGVNYPCSSITSYSAFWSFISGSGSSAGTLAVTFFGSQAPASGTYKAVTTATSSNEVEIAVTANGSEYQSTGGNGANQNVTITISKGKISVQGSSIEMSNLDNPSDSSALSVNVSNL